MTYGIPSVSVIRSLVEKYGFAKTDKLPVPLTDNTLVENFFVSKGVTDGLIVCVEDVVNEIITAGPHFSLVMEFLEPFHLKGYRKWTKSLTLFSEGGMRGNRGYEMDDFIKRCIG